MRKIIPYEKIRDQLSCLDMLVCDHKRLFWRYVGHTASIYRNGAGQLQVFESTQMSYSGMSGVQLHPMGEWLEHYAGKVSVRQLLYKGYPYRTYSDTLAFEMMKRQEAFIRSVRGTSYPNLKNRSGRWKLILARLDFEIHGHDVLTYHGKDTGIFCTHLKAKELQECMVLKKDFPPNEAEPRNTREHSLCWTFNDFAADGWSFGPEKQIK